MTRVFVYRGRGTARIRMRGHARMACEPGHDLVCAALSQMACALIAALEGEEAAGRARIRCAQAGGRVDITARAVSGRGARVDAMAAMFAAGIRLLNGAYPQCVKYACGRGAANGIRLIRAGRWRAGKTAD